MAAALVYRHDGTPVNLSFELIKDSYGTPAILRFCKRLVRMLGNKPTFLIWDRLAAHRSKVVRDYLAQHNVEPILLPAYSPDLNPTEWLWANLSGVELANLGADSIEEAEYEARSGIRRVKRKISLLEGFMKGTGLSFTQVMSR